MSKSQAPTVVIGAGLAGMSAAISLARTGRPVELIEAGDAVGGCCSNSTVDGFRFNNGAVYVAVPSLLRSAFHRLGIDFDTEVPLLPVSSPLESHLDDGTVVRIADAWQSRVLGTEANRRTDVLRRGLQQLQRDWAPVYRALLHKVLPFESSLPRALAHLWRYLPRMRGRADSLIASYFPDPDLQAAIASTLLYTGLPPDRLPATQIIGLLALLEEGFHLPRGGMGAISTALHRELQRLGVPIRLASRVERIDVDRGAVQSVTLAGGERIATDRIIATCSGFALINQLLPADARPRRLVRTARRAPLSHRAIAIQLGCSGAALPDAFIVNHVPAMGQQGRMHEATSGAPRWLSYTVPTRVVPDLAPEGKSIIELYAPVSGIAAASEWSSDQTMHAVEAHIAALSAKLPGLQIETVRTMDPQDFALRRHLYEGALYGIAPGATPDTYFPHRTAVRGLYLAGQTTFPGYGVAPAVLSGILAAESLAID